MTQNDIIQAIETFFRSEWPAGGTNTSFYIGISADGHARLFEGHKVDEKTDKWVCYKADSELVARNVEKYFLDLGMDGGAGGGDDDTDEVYCFLQNSHTIR